MISRDVYSGGKQQLPVQGGTLAILVPLPKGLVEVSRMCQYCLSRKVCTHHT